MSNGSVDIQLGSCLALLMEPPVRVTKALCVAVSVSFAQLVMVVVIMQVVVLMGMSVGRMRVSVRVDI